MQARLITYRVVTNHAIVPRILAWDEPVAPPRQVPKEGRTAPFVPFLIGSIHDEQRAQLPHGEGRTKAGTCLLFAAENVQNRLRAQSQTGVSVYGGYVIGRCKTTRPGAIY